LTWNVNVNTLLLLVSLQYSFYYRRWPWRWGNVDVQGEMLGLKMTVNSTVAQLSTVANEVTRVDLEVGTKGILGGQAFVPEVQGMWKVCNNIARLSA
jgi:hypothetical protein